MSDMIFCTACGAKMVGGSRFCPSCGTAVPEQFIQPESSFAYHQSEQVADQGQPSFRTHTKATQGASGSMKKKPAILETVMALPKQIKIAAIAVVAILVVLIVILANVLSITRIKLSDYVVTEFSGYDGYGTLSCYFDETAFVSDYSGKITCTDSSVSSYYLYMYYGIDDYAEYLSYEYLEDSSARTIEYADGVVNGSLCNGDQITITWSESLCEEIESRYKVKFKKGSTTVTVSDLEEVQSVDIFSAVTVEFSGISPVVSARLSIDSTEDWATILSSYDFTLSQESGLVENDTVTVTLDEECVAYLGQYYGVKPESMEKEYVVENVAKYITQVSDIPDSLVNDLKTASEKKIKTPNLYYNIWDSDTTFSSLEYEGMYLFYDSAYETQAFSSYCTELYVIYKITVHEEEESIGLDRDYSFYTWVSYSNPYLEADGTGTVDLEDNYRTYDQLIHEFSYTNGYGFSSTRKLYYYGYETLDDLITTICADCSGYTDYDTNLSDSTVASSDTTNEVAAEETKTETNSEYLCSFSSDRLITEADMDELESSDYGDLPGDRSLAQMIINEIYAKNGCQFESEEVQEYFETKSWYQEIGSYESDKSVVYSSMSSIEQDNITFLQGL